MALFLTPKEVAARWSCSASHVRRLIRSGQLRAMRLGSDWRIGVAAVEAYETAQTSDSDGESAAAAVTHAPAESVAIGELVLPERWWEMETTGAASSAAGRGRSTGKEKRRSAGTKRR